MIKTFLYSNFHDMSLKKKIGLITAIALTVASLIALPCHGMVHKPKEHCDCYSRKCHSLGVLYI